MRARGSWPLPAGQLLGRGGMGEVYLAHDETLDRDVAIKFVASDKVGDEAAGRRLLHEAHAARSRPPCIARSTKPARTLTGKAFIVMQYSRASRCRRSCRRGRCRRERPSASPPTSRALAAAPKSNIVHAT